MNGQQPIAMEDKLSKSAPVPKLRLMVNIGNPENLLRRRHVWQVQEDPIEGISQCHTS